MPGATKRGAAAGVDLFLHQQGIDTTTPGGKAVFQMLGVFVGRTDGVRKIAKQFG